MLEHLKLFMGTRNQMCDHYMIRFLDKCMVEFITTDGYAMCINRVPISHGSAGKTIAITPEDFNQIIKLIVIGTVFALNDSDLTIYSGSQVITVNTLNPSRIPDIDTIINIPCLLTDVEPCFSTTQLAKVAEYCRLIGTDEVCFGFAGNRLPMKAYDDSGSWTIFLMPVGVPE